MILVIGIALLVWFLWGVMFDPEPNLGPVERAIKHPGKWSRRVMSGWIEDARKVLIDPDSTEEEKEKAMRDIEVFSKYVKEERT